MAQNTHSSITNLHNDESQSVKMPSHSACNTQNAGIDTFYNRTETERPTSLLPNIPNKSHCVDIPRFGMAQESGIETLHNRAEIERPASLPLNIPHALTNSRGEKSQGVDIPGACIAQESGIDVLHNRAEIAGSASLSPKGCYQLSGSQPNSRNDAQRSYATNLSDEMLFLAENCSSQAELSCALVGDCVVDKNSAKTFSCNLCLAEFKTTADFRKHYVTHACSVPHNSSDLDEHTRKHSVTCDKCGAKFEYDCNLQRHMVFHSDPIYAFPCKYCHLRFKSVDTLQYHLRIRHRKDDKPFTCDVCSDHFAQKCELRTHVKTHGLYSCDQCPKTFKLFMNYRSHLKKHFGSYGQFTQNSVVNYNLQTPSENTGIYRNPCTPNSEIINNLPIPSEIMTEKVSAEINEPNFSSLLYYSPPTDFKPSAEKVSMKLCNPASSVSADAENLSRVVTSLSADSTSLHNPTAISTQSLITLNSALPVVHSSVHLDLPPSVFINCCAPINRETVLDSNYSVNQIGHTQTSKLPSLASENTLKELSAKGKQLCAETERLTPSSTECGNESGNMMSDEMFFPAENILPNNLTPQESTYSATESISSQFECVNTSAINQSTSNFDQYEQSNSGTLPDGHFRGWHTLQYSDCTYFVCNQCSAKFNSFPNLESHLQSHKTESYTCDLCSKQFRIRVYYERHLKIHGDHTSFSCVECPATFTKRLTLQKHLATQHSRDKIFPCKYCSAKFTSKSALSRHHRTHTNERPFTCQNCPARFETIGHLRRHIVVTHANTEKFSCSHCSLQYKYEHSLRTHLRESHNVKPFACNECSASFTYHSNLLGHLKTHGKDDPVPPPRSCQVNFPPPLKVMYPAAEIQPEIRETTAEIDSSEHHSHSTDFKPSSTEDPTNLPAAEIQCKTEQTTTEIDSNSADLFKRSNASFQGAPEIAPCENGFSNVHSSATRNSVSPVGENPAVAESMPFVFADCSAAVIKSEPSQESALTSEPFSEILNSVLPVVARLFEPPSNSSIGSTAANNEIATDANHLVDKNSRILNSTLPISSSAPTKPISAEIDVPSTSTKECQELLCQEVLDTEPHLSISSSLEHENKQLDNSTPQRCKQSDEMSTTCEKIFPQVNSTSGDNCSDAQPDLQQSEFNNISGDNTVTEGSIQVPSSHSDHPPDASLTLYAETLTCGLCPAQFKTSTDLESHCITHTRARFPSVVTSGVSPSISSNEKSSQTPYSSVACLTLNTETFSCGLCAAQFKTCADLESHSITHASVGFPSVATSVTSTVISHDSRSIDLEPYIQKDSNTGHFFCKLCPSSFKIKGRLVRHLRNLHSKENPFTCDKCPAHFKHSIALKRHLRMCHPEGLLGCNYCSARFPLIRSLFSHVRKHHLATSSNQHSAQMQRNYDVRFHPQTTSETKMNESVHSDLLSPVFVDCSEAGNHFDVVDLDDFSDDDNVVNISEAGEHTEPSEFEPPSENDPTILSAAVYAENSAKVASHGEQRLSTSNSVPCFRDNLLSETVQDAVVIDLDNDTDEDSAPKIPCSPEYLQSSEFEPDPEKDSMLATSNQDNNPMKKSSETAQSSATFDLPSTSRPPNFLSQNSVASVDESAAQITILESFSLADSTTEHLTPYVEELASPTGENFSQSSKLKSETNSLDSRPKSKNSPAIFKCDLESGSTVFELDPKIPASSSIGKTSSVQSDDKNPAEIESKETLLSTENEYKNSLSSTETKSQLKSAVAADNHCLAEPECVVLDDEANRIKISDSLSHLKLYMSSSGEVLFRCLHCPERFKTSSDFKQHFISHSGRDFFPCPYCFDWFPDSQKLVEHVIKHFEDGGFACSRCSAWFHRSREHFLNFHMEDHRTENPFSCDLCPLKFKISNDLKEHLISHCEERDFESDSSESESVVDENGIVTLGLDRKNDLSIASSVVENNSAQRINELANPAQRINKFVNPAQQGNNKVANHAVNKSQEQHSFTRKSSPQPNERLSMQPDSSQHEMVNDKVIQEPANNFYDKNNPVQIIESPSVSKSISSLFNEEFYWCMHCSSRFETSSDYKQHFVSHVTKWYFPCLFCFKWFKSSGEHNQHVIEHTSEKGFSCNECNMYFKTEQLLNRHLGDHLSEEPFSCYECPEKYKTSNDLKEHIFSNHFEMKNAKFTCGQCPLKFKTNYELTQHLKSHGEFFCDRCAITFKSESVYILHLITHTEQNAAPESPSAQDFVFIDCSGENGNNTKTDLVDLISDDDSEGDLEIVATVES